MGRTRTFIVASAIASVLAVAAGTGTGWAAPGQELPWNSPNKVTSGVAVHVASIKPCPPPPHPGDQVLVQIFLVLDPAGGGSGQIVTARPDGSWAGNVRFFFSTAASRHTRITATCLDFTGFTGIPYASYQSRPTQVFPVGGTSADL